MHGRVIAFHVRWRWTIALVMPIGLRGTLSHAELYRFFLDGLLDVNHHTVLERGHRAACPAMVIVTGETNPAHPNLPSLHQAPDFDGNELADLRLSLLHGWPHVRSFNHF